MLIKPFLELIASSFFAVLMAAKRTQSMSPAQEWHNMALHSVRLQEQSKWTTAARGFTASVTTVPIFRMAAQAALSHRTAHESSEEWHFLSVLSPGCKSAECRPEQKRLEQSLLSEWRSGLSARLIYLHQQSYLHSSTVTKLRRSHP